jgi:hypothetical protein
MRRPPAPGDSKSSLPHYPGTTLIVQLPSEITRPQRRARVSTLAWFVLMLAFWPLLAAGLVALAIASTLVLVGGLVLVAGAALVDVVAMASPWACASGAVAAASAARAPPRRPGHHDATG